MRNVITTNIRHVPLRAVSVKIASYILFPNYRYLLVHDIFFIFSTNFRVRDNILRRHIVLVDTSRRTYLYYLS